MPRPSPEERVRRRAARLRAKREPPVYWCPHCHAPVRYRGFYECPECHRTIPMEALLTCTDTPPLVDCGETTTTKEDAMPSHASKAADRAEENRKQRETSSGATLQLVPEPAADPPKSGATKGDEARAAIVAELPEWQQAEYARLRTGGTRHVTALAQARRVPDPATPDDEVAKAAADLFAAFTAGQVGAAAPPVTAAAAAGKPEPKPAAAAPKPAPAQPKPKPAPAAPRVLPGGSSDDCTRHIGTVTVTVLAAGGDTEPVTFDCEHGSRNGHMTVESAEVCARKLLRNHPAGITGTRVHPVLRDRRGTRVSA